MRNHLLGPTKRRGAETVRIPHRFTDRVVFAIVASYSDRKLPHIKELHHQWFNKTPTVEEHLQGGTTEATKAQATHQQPLWYHGDQQPSILQQHLSRPAPHRPPTPPSPIRPLNRLGPHRRAARPHPRPPRRRRPPVPRLHRPRPPLQANPRQRRHHMGQQPPL